MRGKHQTLDKELKRSIRWLESIDGVSKIVIGLSESCRHKYSPGHLRYKMDVDAGITLNGYSGNGVVNLFVRIDPIEARGQVKKKIKLKFQG